MQKKKTRVQLASRVFGLRRKRSKGRDLATIEGCKGETMLTRLSLFVAAMLLSVTASAYAAEETPLLVHEPTLSRTQIVFVYGGYLWSVPREGGEARQLTTGGHEAAPIFSPDGAWIAFTGEYDGNIDAYVMPAEGGEPRRLTWHPAPDVVVGWTPDSRKVMFHSPRE